MTSIGSIKRAMATMLGAGVLALIAASLAGLTTVVISFGTGANPSDAFTPAAEPLAVRSETVEWNPDEPGLLRSMERATRTDVANTWVGALSGEADTTWYSGGALERRLDAGDLESAADVAWSRHAITTYFYSLDGQVLGLEIDSDGTVDTGDGHTLSLTERYEVVMVLRDGNWRVERLTRL
ncbi:MAG: hypothetical protein KJN63_08245 [Acidimicrobiia bacterium]|nr:hypothetical protein [Acidimicrobiia bacterium]